MLETIYEATTTWLQKNKSFFQAVLFIAGDSVITAMPLIFENTFEKYAAFAAAAETFKDIKYDSLCFVLDTWTSQHKIVDGKPDNVPHEAIKCDALTLIWISRNPKSCKIITQQYTDYEGNIVLGEKIVLDEEKGTLLRGRIFSILQCSEDDFFNN